VSTIPWLSFVDSIATSPTLRLDLVNPQGLRPMAEGTSFGTPELRRAVASTVMTDGARVPASAYDTRVITLVLRPPDNASADTAASLLQDLVQEVDRPTNFLRWQPDTTNPLFFRTFRSDLSGVVWDALERKFTATLLAEPFGLGLKQTLSPVTVNNDPSAGSNGMFFDVTGVLGDVETPLFGIYPSGLITSGRRRSAIAIRRRGTPSSAPRLQQVESMTLGTDTSSLASAGASGGNYARTTFATNTGLITRASTTAFPASASVDARGSYRVYCRVRQNTATDTLTMRLRWGDASALITNDSFTLPSTPDTGVWFYCDLGIVQIPGGFDPAEDGPSGVALSASPIYLSLDAQRNSGSGSLDLDVLIFLPADDRTLLVKWPGVSGPTDFILDADRPAVYPRDAAGAVDTVDQAELAGAGPLVSPNVTNRIFVARDIGTGTSGTGLVGDALSGTTVITPYYWPKYLAARPATT
jgi:hypothetical protein